MRECRELTEYRPSLDHSAAGRPWIRAGSLPPAVTEITRLPPSMIGRPGPAPSVPHLSLGAARRRRPAGNPPTTADRDRPAHGPSGDGDRRSGGRCQPGGRQGTQSTDSGCAAHRAAIAGRAHALDGCVRRGRLSVSPLFRSSPNGRPCDEVAMSWYRRLTMRFPAPRRCRRCVEADTLSMPSPGGWGRCGLTSGDRRAA
jgi:hypothetical protein